MSKRCDPTFRQQNADWEQLDPHWKRLLELAIQAVARRICADANKAKPTDLGQSAEVSTTSSSPKISPRRELDPDCSDS
jgi:hypothetical protein